MSEEEYEVIITPSGMSANKVTLFKIPMSFRDRIAFRYMEMRLNEKAIGFLSTYDRKNIAEESYEMADAMIMQSGRHNKKEEEE